MPKMGQRAARPTRKAAWTTDLVNGDHFVGSSSTPAARSDCRSESRSSAWHGGTIWCWSWPTPASRRPDIGARRRSRRARPCRVNRRI